MNLCALENVGNCEWPFSVPVLGSRNSVELFFIISSVCCQTYTVVSLGGGVGGPPQVTPFRGGDTGIK